MTMTIGMKGRSETMVTDQNTAAAVSSGAMPVFSTPMMVALMEGASVDAVKDCLAEGQGTVGVSLEITHDAATPVGMKVWAEAELTGIDRRMLTFAVNAFDEMGPIGKGTHRRFIIDNEKFLAKVEEKRKG